MNRRDVLILGAGVAGSSAAYYLASKGHKVTLIEKSDNSLIKPCAGGIASSVQDFFPFKLNSVVEETINRVDFRWNSEDQVIADLPGESPFWIVRREKLDMLLREKSINAGAELLQPCKAISLERCCGNWRVNCDDGKVIESKYVILANGSNSEWARKLNLGPKKVNLASTVSIRVEGKGNLLSGTTRFEFGLVKHGFAWAFPLSDCINIGIGSFLGDKELNIESVLQNFLPSLGLSQEKANINKSFLSVWNGHWPLHGEGIVVVGDAASLCDPFLAEGIRPAIISGIEAAKSINKLIIGEIEELTEYSQTMKTKWGDSMAWGKRIAQVFYRFPRIGYQLGIKRPTAPERIAQILSGKMSYGDIAQRVIKRLIFSKV